jgi:hypothetical protein
MDQSDTIRNWSVALLRNFLAIRTQTSHDDVQILLFLDSQESKDAEQAAPSLSQEARISEISINVSKSIHRFTANS